MKKNKITILATAGLIIAFIIAALSVFRVDVKTIVADAEKELKYKEIKTESFNSLEIPAGWNAKIRQGRTCKIEVAAGENFPFKEQIITANGNLQVQIDTLGENPIPSKLYARITLPSLKLLKAGKGARVRLENFASDSISLMFDDGVEFIDKNNTFKQVSIKTYGDVTMQITDIVAE